MTERPSNVVETYRRLGEVLARANEAQAAFAISYLRERKRRRRIAFWQPWYRRTFWRLYYTVRKP